MEEIWKDIIIDGEDYSEWYQVSNFGRVKNIDRIVTRSDGKKCRYEGKILTPHKDGDFYLQVRIRNEYKRSLKRVNRLVATVFLPNPDNLPQVAHIDGNRQNNIVTNLRWSTIKDNVNGSLTLKGCPIQCLVKIIQGQNQLYVIIPYLIISWNVQCIMKYQCRQ